MAVKPKITDLLKQLNEGVYEKEEVIALSLLSAIAGESIFLLGPPGVAKSLIARRLKFAFKDGESFEYLMNRFSTPDEIFGPVSISKLKDEDKYERVVSKYLPSATVVFLDEIWKAGPSIQNALLTVLNEKIYRNGDQEIKVPMKALISASNELPSKDQGLEALWDRFLVRYIVEGISDKSRFNEMISKPVNQFSNTVGDVLKITGDEYVKWNTEIDKIEIPENVFNVIDVVRNYLNTHNGKNEKKENQIYISDRRWKKIVRLLRTSAFLNDRKSVDLMDCFLIQYCIWNETEQKTVVAGFIREALQKHGYQLALSLNDIKSELKELDSEVLSETSYLKEVNAEIPYIVDEKFYEILKFNENARILISDYKLLREKEQTDVNLYIKTYYQHSYSPNNNSGYRLKRLNSNSIVINNNEYPLRTTEGKAQKTFTRKPHQAVQKEWDKRTSVILNTCSNQKTQIAVFKSNDLEHIRTNLFVSPNFAYIVEGNLNALENEIVKLEIEAGRIKHFYETIEDQTDKAPKQIEEKVK